VVAGVLGGGGGVAERVVGLWEGMRSEMSGRQLRLASLNLCWQMPMEARQRQVEALADFDVVLLQEARRTDLGLDAASFRQAVRRVRMVQPGVSTIAVYFEDGSAIEAQPW